MARVLSIVPDLLLGSRVEESLRATGHEVVGGTVATAEDSGAELIVADLDAVDPAELADLAVPAIGFYSHVDVETKRRGEAAGLALVVPRSRMARELPALVERVLSG